MYAEGTEMRTRIGVMFQSGALFGSMTLLENVMLPLEMHTDLPRPPVPPSRASSSGWSGSVMPPR